MQVFDKAGRAGPIEIRHVWYDPQGDVDRDGIPNEDDDDDDNDFLPDPFEREISRTSPFNADTDRDGLEDREEMEIYGSDPLSNDTDRDNLLDGDEVNDYETEADLAGHRYGWTS